MMVFVHVDAMVVQTADEFDSSGCHVSRYGNRKELIMGLLGGCLTHSFMRCGEAKKPSKIR
jgi:hypothetical protein